MRKLSLILLLVVLLSIYGFVSSVLGDLLVGDVQEWLGENFEGKGKEVRWGIAIFTFVAAASVTVYFFLKGKKSGEELEKPSPLNKEDVFQKARAGQRKAFEERSNRKLAGRDFIDLEVSYTVEGSYHLAPLLNKGVKEGEKGQDLLKVFEGADGRLLIIGSPGSGKTTLLLQLAIALLDKYEEQIPVVLDIATWQPRFKTIEEWAVELLPDMGFNKRLAQQLVTEKKLLPLFDGLDELGEESQPDFLSAVEKYAAESANKFVITSRKAEYAATIDAAVEYQVVVNPFTLFQIREALHKKPSPERTAMLDRIDKDEHFAEAIKTPFYLNAVQLLFSNKNLSQQLVFAADNLEGRQLEIEVAFVEHALGGLENYSKEDGQRWLAFLADRMSRRGLVLFELFYLQYHWGWFGNRGIFLAKLVEGFVYSLINSPVLGIFTFLAIGFLRGLAEGLVFALAYSLVYILVYSLASALKSDRPSINVVDKVRWSIKGYLFRVKEYMVRSLVFGLVFGLIVALAKGLVIGLIFGLVIGLTGALVFSLIFMLNYETSAYLKTDKPYQRFHGSFKSMHFSILQHWHLCYLLRKKGLLPKRYPNFLNEATKQNILESDGGTWRFRHRILQKYFVGVWQEKYGDDPDLADNWEGE